MTNIIERTSRYLMVHTTAEGLHVIRKKARKYNYVIISIQHETMTRIFVSMLKMHRGRSCE